MIQDLLKKRIPGIWLIFIFFPLVPAVLSALSPYLPMAAFVMQLMIMLLMLLAFLIVLPFEKFINPSCDTGSFGCGIYALIVAPFLGFLIFYGIPSWLYLRANKKEKVKTKAMVLIAYLMYVGVLTLITIMI